jgi:hypothetical protein
MPCNLSVFDALSLAKVSTNRSTQNPRFQTDRFSNSSAARADRREVFIPISPPFLKHSPLFNGNSLDRTFSAEGGHTASMPFRRPPAFPDQITLYREKVGPPEDIGIGRISAAG